MHVVLSPYGARGNLEPWAGLAVKLGTLLAEVRVWAPADRVEPPGSAGGALMPIGASR